MRRSRFWLFVVIAAFFILGLIYSALIPLLEPPDELWHFMFADHLAKGRGLPTLTADKSAYLREGGQPPLYYALVALVIMPFDRSDFPGWERFNASHPAITRGATSDTPNVFIHTAREDWPWTGSVLAVHVARLVSLAFGALTVVGVYQVGRIVMGRDDLALWSAALIAFTPQFVFISASVNNDSLAAATSVWVGVAAIQISTPQKNGGQAFKFPISKRYVIGIGILLGLGLLAKLGGLILIPLIGLAFLVRLFRQRSHLRFETPALPKGPERSAGASVLHLIFDGLVILGMALAVSGWWFARNVRLYGDPLGWSVWLADIGVRTPTPMLWQLIPELPALFRTYWAELPAYSLSDPLFWILVGITTLALAGIIKSLIRALRLTTADLKSDTPALPKGPERSAGASVWYLIFLLLWLGIVFAGVLRYMQTTPAAQGRLLFPALAPIGVLMAWGLAAWSKRPWLPGIVAVGLFVLTLVVPFVLVQPSFARPIVAQLPADAHSMQAQFGDHVELIGVRLFDRVEPGGTLRVTTYWRALKAVPRDQRLLIRLMRPEGNSAGQLDTMLGTNLYPTTLWQPGQIVVDTHYVRADADLPAFAMLRVHIGVGDEVEPLLPVSGPQAWSSGDVADVGQVQVMR